MRGREERWGRRERWHQTAAGFPLVDRVRKRREEGGRPSAAAARLRLRRSF